MNILEEENHIKDGLSRIVVEIIKREWPQHWRDMLAELDTLSRQGVRRGLVHRQTLELPSGGVLAAALSVRQSVRCSCDEQSAPV